MSRISEDDKKIVIGYLDNELKEIDKKLTTAFKKDAGAKEYKDCLETVYKLCNEHVDRLFDSQNGFDETKNFVDGGWMLATYLKGHFGSFFYQEDVINGYIKCQKDKKILLDDKTDDKYKIKIIKEYKQVLDNLKEELDAVMNQ